MALSDAEVDKQIKQMIAFIEQEADEKVEEIYAKAEEEFNIEKGRLVQNERVKIIEFYDRKEKQVELQKKILQSNMLNQSRLRILKAKEDGIAALMDEAKARLAQATADTNRYSTLLRSLMTQAFIQLLEPSVLVRCRESDINLCRGQLDAAAEEYKQLSGKEIKTALDMENFLQEHTCGGVVVYAARGKIFVSNTLDTRLQLFMQQMLPEIRGELFGQNESRKFFD